MPNSYFVRALMSKFRRNFGSAKFPFGDISMWRKFRYIKTPAAKNTVAKISSAKNPAESQYYFKDSIASLKYTELKKLLNLFFEPCMNRKTCLGATKHFWTYIFQVLPSILNNIQRMSFVLNEF